MISKRYDDGRYSVIDANRIYVTQLSRAAAARQLAELGVADPETVLRNLVSPAIWRATFQSAVSSTTETLTRAAEQAASVDDVAAVRERQVELTTAVAELQTDIATVQREREREHLESQLETQAELMQGIMGQHGMAGRDVETAVYKHLWETPLGKRVLELRAAE